MNLTIMFIAHNLSVVLILIMKKEKTCCIKQEDARDCSRERKEPFIKYDEFLKERHDRGKVSTGHLLTGAGIFIAAGAVLAVMSG